MSVAGEAGHVGPDLADDGLGTDLFHPRGRHQELDCRAKGLEGVFDLAIDRLDGFVEGIDLPKMKRQQEAVMLGHPAAQRLAQLFR